MRESMLAIELSQRVGSIALRPRADGGIFEMEVPVSDDSNDHLMACIDALCTQHGVTPTDLAAIAVSCGPGAFTGLRVACATAKAIADVTGCGLVAVPSALVVARTAVRAGELDGVTDCTVALASKAGTVWCTHVSIARRMPRAISAGLRAENEAESIAFPLLGDAQVPPAFIRAAFGRGGLHAAAWSAAACLEVGEALLGAGERADPLVLAPLYPRQAEAVTLWEARHGSHPAS